MTATVLRRHGTTVVLCLLALAAAVVLLLDRGSISTDEAQQHRGRLLPVWRSEELRAVQVRGGGNRYELRLEPDGTDGERAWQLRCDDRTVAADQQEVGELLAALELARYERRVDPTGVPPGQLGFDDRAWVVELDMTRQHFVVHIGAEAASPAGGRYARVGGGEEVRTVVISGELATALERECDALRSRRLVPYPSSSLRSISLHEGDGSVRFTVRRSAGGDGPPFLVVDPAPDGRPRRADRRVVNALLIDLAELEATRFHDDAEGAAGGDALRYALTLAVDDDEPRDLRLDVYGACPTGGGSLVVRRGPPSTSACVESSSVAKLDLPAGKLLDRHVIGAARGNVFELQIRTDQRVIEVARQGTGWRLRRPSEGDADAEAIERWLDGVLAAEGVLLPDGPPAAGQRGLAPPRVTGRVVSLAAPTAGGPERIERFEVGSEHDGRVVVRRLEDGALLEVSAAAAAALTPQTTSLRPAQVLDESPDRIVSLEAVAEPIRQRVERADGQSDWRLVEPTGLGLGVDPALVGRLSRLLGALRTPRWVADSPRPEFGLDAPRCVLRFGLREPSGDAGAGPAAPQQRDRDGPSSATRLVVLRLGGETDGGHFASLDGDAAVFVAPHEVVRLAERWWLDRRAPAVDTAELARVVLSSPSSERRLVLERRDGKLTATPGPSSADESVASTVRSSLGELWAEAVTGVGPPAPEAGFDRPRLTIELYRQEAAVPEEPVVLRVGADDLLDDTRIHYVRRDDIDATFAVAQARLRPLLDLL